MSSQSPQHHHLQGDDGDVIQATHPLGNPSSAPPPAVVSSTEPHLPPAVSPNVASVVPAIPQATTNSLFDADPFVVHDNVHGGTIHTNDNDVKNGDNTENVETVETVENVANDDAHVGNVPQQVEVATGFPQDQDTPQTTSAFTDPPPQHVDTDADIQTNAVSIVTSMPGVSVSVSQEMNSIPVSLGGTAVDTAVPMVTVASESMGIGNVTVSGAMSTDIYTNTAGSVVVSAAQLSNAHNQAFAGMEYMAVGTTAATPGEAQKFTVGPVDDGTAPKFQDEVVNVVAALPGTEAVGVHAPVNTVNAVPVVTSVNNISAAQPPAVPVVMPNNAVNVNVGGMPNAPDIPFGGETVDKCVECEVCGSLFGDAGSLKRHAARAHKAATGKGPVFCSHCSASLKNEQNLRRHIAVCHSGSQENRCNMCSASFSSRGSLRIHQQSVHSVPPAVKGRTPNGKGTGLPGRPRGVVKPKAEKSYLCDMCTDTFKWKGNLKRHRELRHLQLRPFNCHICHASFGTKSNMRVHLITHQNTGTGVTPQMPK